MSIASRITEINSHLLDDYSVLSVAGADLTNVDKNIVNLKETWQERLLYFMNNGTDIVWNNWNKATGSGTEISLNNTLEAKMGIKLKGNTSQYSTTGKNIFNFNGTYYKRNTYATISFSNQDITVTNTNSSQNNYIWYNIPVRIGETITISYGDMAEGTSSTNNRIVFSFSDTEITSYVDMSSYSSVDKTSKYKTTTSTGQYLILGFRTASDGSYTISNVQVEYNSSATSYEPYTNGPSPNPSYPQDIHVVSGDNSIKVEGKNLWGGFPSVVGRNNGGITFYNNADGTISASGTANANAQSIANTVAETNNHYITLEAGNYVLSGGISSVRMLDIKNIDNTSIATDTGNGVRFTLEKTTSVYVRANISSGTALTDTEIFRPMIEKSSTKTSYQPYQSQTYPINLGDIELCKIGDYQDYIGKSTGKNLLETDNVNYNSSGTYNLTLGNDIEAGSYIFSGITNVSSGAFALYGIDENSTQDTLLANKNWSTLSTGYSFTTTKKYVSLKIYTNVSANAYLMLNEGSTALPYEPYGTGWYIKKDIGKVVLDGTENIYNGQIYGNYFRAYAIINDMYKNSVTNANLFSNYFYGDINAMSQTNSEPGMMCQYQTRNWIYFVLDVENIDGVKTWLSTHNTTFYYPLSIPTYTKITDSTLASQLNALELARSYNEQTNLSQTNDDLPFILDAMALEEW